MNDEDRKLLQLARAWVLGIVGFLLCIGAALLIAAIAFAYCQLR